MTRVGGLGPHIGGDQSVSTPFSGFDPRAGHGVGRLGLRVGG